MARVRQYAVPDSGTAQVRRPHVLADGTTLDRTAAGGGSPTRMAFGRNSTKLPAGGLSHVDATPEKHAAAPPLPLHVLMFEDSAADADLILQELRNGGYDPIARRVASREEMLEALKQDSWQIVLLDYTLHGGGTALDALAALDELKLDLPAILISGVIGEEEAADALRAGARDFVNKGNLTRLVPAVARELHRVEARRRQRASVQALEESEQRLRLALGAGGMASWEWDLASGRLYWSEKLEAMFGLEPGAFGGTYAEFIELVHPDDRELVGASVEQAIGHDSPAVVYRAVWPDATIHWHERKSQRVLNADGRCEVMAGVTFDVTEREEAAQALRESEERFRLIAEHAHDLIGLLDAAGHYRYASPSFESILGYPTGSLLGTTATELIHRHDWPEGSTWGGRNLCEMRLRKADGDWLWVESLSYEIAGPGETQFALIARDISERKRAEAGKQRLEDELRQAQKMEAVGLLAGGIAHDFNNLLTVISGYTEILLRRLGREGEGTTEIAEDSTAAARAARLTRQLLAYSRKQILELRALDLTDLVTETHTMLARVIGENIEFSTTLAENLGSICADDGQIEQIVMNLVVNARDAMPEVGKLLLETSNVTVTDVSPHKGPAAPGDYVVLAITDTGEGMDPATISRIFEPFFTTKEQGAGTGLGLSTVYGIVKQSGGHIDVESEPGLGTRFRLYFPQVAEEAVAFSPKPPDERLLMGSETILLVEDEEALRDLGKEMLETYEYKVLLARDGAAALALAEKHPHPIDLLMTDILMPRMGGIELAKRLSTLRPEMKILYTSGYNDSGGSLVRVPGARYLQKPYAMEELARTVRELLD
jgi:two-component system cell cycle sensor histidine kinase/response regulator CckA